MIDNFINDPYLVVFDGVFERAFCQPRILKYAEKITSECDKYFMGTYLHHIF